MYRRLSPSPSSQFRRSPPPRWSRPPHRPSPIRPQIAGPTPRADETPDSRAGIRTVMLVSPDDAFCAAAACALMDVGFSVLVAPNSMSAIAAFGDRSIDGLITTIRMPRGHPHGLALAKLVRARNSTSMVIFLTDEPRFISAEGTLLNGKSAVVCPVGDVPSLIHRARIGLGHGPEMPGSV